MSDDTDGDHQGDVGKADSDSQPAPKKRKRGALSLSESTTNVSRPGLAVRNSGRGSTRGRSHVESSEVLKMEEAEPDVRVDGTPKSKSKRQPVKKVAVKTEAESGWGEVKIHAPKDWELVYGIVKEMRKAGGAPVDTMGCERLADEAVSEKVSKSSFPRLSTSSKHRAY